MIGAAQRRWWADHPEVGNKMSDAERAKMTGNQRSTGCRNAAGGGPAVKRSWARLHMGERSERIRAALAAKQPNKGELELLDILNGVTEVGVAQHTHLSERPVAPVAGSPLN